MPQRTNAFQQLVKRIETALHGTQTNVVESAMIYDFDAETDVEVDVLVTFRIAGRDYRSAIECRDHGRKQGPSWIRDLRTKRDACRLDKIVAVSSSGFSATARTAAEKYGIQVVHPEENTTDWVDAITPSTGVSTYGIATSDVVEVILDSPLRERLPEKVVPEDMIISLLEPGKGMPLPDFLKYIEGRIVKTHSAHALGLSDENAPTTTSLLVSFSIACQPNAQIVLLAKPSENLDAPAQAIDLDTIKGIEGIAIMRMTRKPVDVRTILYGGQEMREQSFKIRFGTGNGDVETDVRITSEENSDDYQERPHAAVHFDQTGGPVSPLKVGNAPFTFVSRILDTEQVAARGLGIPSTNVSPESVIAR